MTNPNEPHRMEITVEVPHFDMPPRQARQEERLHEQAIARYFREYFRDKDAPWSVTEVHVKTTVQPAANPSHKVRFGDDHFTILHPLKCRPKLFECPFNEAAADADVASGTYFCRLNDDGTLRVEDRCPE